MFQFLKFHSNDGIQCIFIYKFFIQIIPLKLFSLVCVVVVYSNTRITHYNDYILFVILFQTTMTFGLLPLSFILPFQTGLFILYIPQCAHVLVYF